MSWPCDRRQRYREMGKLPSNRNTNTVESLQSSVVCVSEPGTWREGVTNLNWSRSSWRMSWVQWGETCVLGVLENDRRDLISQGLLCQVREFVMYSLAMLSPWLGPSPCIVLFYHIRSLLAGSAMFPSLIKRGLARKWRRSFSEHPHCYFNLLLVPCCYNQASSLTIMLLFWSA